MNHKHPPLNSKEPLIELLKTVPSIDLYEMERKLKVPKQAISNAISGKLPLPRKHLVFKHKEICKYLHSVVRDRLAEVEAISQYLMEHENPPE